MTITQRMHPFIDGKSVLLLLTVYFCNVMHQYASLDMKVLIGIGSLISIVVTVLYNGIKTYHEILKFYRKYRMKKNRQDGRKSVDEDQFD